jgi:hypothetical protein
MDKSDLPAHSDVPHVKGYWMKDTCERCRRQSDGQRQFLTAIRPDVAEQWYDPSKPRPNAADLAAAAEIVGVKP